MKRIYVDKKEGFQVEAQGLYDDFKNNLVINGLEKLHIIDRYDIEGITDEEYELVRDIVFNDTPAVQIHEETLPISPKQLAFAVELLPGHFDQKADSTAQSIQLITQGEKPIVNAAKLIVMEGDVSEDELKKIKDYYINSVESRETALEKPESIKMKNETPQDVQVLSGFINMSHEELASFSIDMNLAMTFEDLQFCQKYFRETENRDPSITELRVIDTYWSDHCRHTTFHTKIQQVEFEQGPYKNTFEEAYGNYKKARRDVYGDRPKNECLMDMAAIAMKKMKKQGLLKDLDESEEVNACSIKVKVDVDGEMQDWLLMFKNETHNHPTEMEPFGGAATCLGGGIRDPLSGRAYVYQAMRITGSADPREKFEDTLTGKLPQRKITQTAMEGYSSYGNQIGGTSGYIREFYDEGFKAKRLELGALVAAVPKDWVTREDSEPSDLIILVGGRTGRDGLGAAVGSSKVQTEESLETSGAEVQKGNPILERKIVRLFRNPEATRLIKKCNDFGAGGVAVAVGELADGLFIDLDKVPVKYEGLDGGEIALSESQERMAVVIDKENLDEFMNLVKAEDLEGTVIAEVTDKNRLQMIWRGKQIVDIDRDFLNTNGIRKKNSVKILMPEEEIYLHKNPNHVLNKDIKTAFIDNMIDINNASQKGLVERFDNTIGSGTVLMQLGGKYQCTPQEGMVAKIPVLEGETSSCSIMTCGYDPKLAKWSTFHGGYYAVIESIAKIVALGGDYRKVRLTFQEYFERLGNDPAKWGKPFSSLLGAFMVQKALDIPSIGGKDSMSGSFEELNVPPSLLSFGVTYDKIQNIVSKEFKEIGSNVVLIKLNIDNNGLVDFEQLKNNYNRIKKLIDNKEVLASSSIGFGGVARSIAEMCLGNKVGFKFNEIETEELFKPLYGSMILELGKDKSLKDLLEGIDYSVVGTTADKMTIEIENNLIELDELAKSWEEPLDEVFPIDKEYADKNSLKQYSGKNIIKKQLLITKPKVIIPIFTGTHGEYDMANCFKNAGAKVETFVFKSLTKTDIEESFRELSKRIRNSQILGLPNGQIYGDEPEAGGKLLKIILDNPYVKESIEELLYLKDGLILGIGEGAIGLIKSGLIQGSSFIARNKNAKFTSTIVDIKLTSKLSPWMRDMELGQIYSAPIATKEGRIVLGNDAEKLIENGQIATQFASINPTGSELDVESLTNIDGRILATLSSIDRIGDGIYKNIDIKGNHKIFESGVKYFG